MNKIEKAYLIIAPDYNEVVSLEVLEKSSKININKEINKALEIYENRFKIELLMFPQWATSSKVYKINQDFFTHIRVKDKLL